MLGSRTNIEPVIHGIKILRQNSATKELTIIRPANILYLNLFLPFAYAALILYNPWTKPQSAENGWYHLILCYNKAVMIFSLKMLDDFPVIRHKLDCFIITTRGKQTSSRRPRQTIYGTLKKYNINNFKVTLV